MFLRSMAVCGIETGKSNNVFEWEQSLNIPLYAPVPNAYKTYLSSRSVTRTLLKETGCSLLPCVTSRAQNEEDFVADVVRAVLGNRDVGVWMFWGEGSKGVDVADACLGEFWCYC